MRTDQATTIHREAYQAPDYTVKQVELEFQLDAVCTRVSARMQVRRLGPPGSPLRFDGEEIALEQICIDGQTLRTDQFTIDESGDLHISAPTLAALAKSADHARFELRTVVTIAPERNTALSGLYQSGASLYTQCEAEGFRRITFFPDRPDVMARYSVTLHGARAQFPVLLCNGNLIEQGVAADGVQHWARWEDPFPKPSYLFALVAGNLVVHEETMRLGSGREALLQVWVEPGNLDKTAHAMQSLQQAIRWDEERFGLELDLDRYMIVAVSDFNMGAMENKGLNLFNSRYVFANPRIATDDDYFHITSVVGHEYFHNWTGNRVTCRDWFQLTLKEGLTVFRDQEFSSDLLATEAGTNLAGASARAVQRIDNVRVLRNQQFVEDAGPMAHPIRPDAYQEINNFYTATVYEKGAEVVRMLQTLLGRDGFRRGIDLYFQRHDGQAVTCDDFVAAMAHANGRDLSAFGRWYSTAGTPKVHAAGDWDAANSRFTLRLSQSLPPVPGRPAEAPTWALPIPIALGLVAPDGTDLIGTRIIELTEPQALVVFESVQARPVLSLGRGFSAPVEFVHAYTTADLAHLLEHDSDPFNRWEAAQRLAVTAILEALDGNSPQATAASAGTASATFIQALRTVLVHPDLDAGFKARVLSLPAEGYVAEQLSVVDPSALRRAREAVRRRVATELAPQWASLAQQAMRAGPYRPDANSAGRRALGNIALGMSVLANDLHMMALASEQVLHADNMTDRLGALHALGWAPAAARDAAIDAFERIYTDEPLALDKWFAHQAMLHRQPGDISVLDRVRALMHHPAFAARNPNRIRALIGSFCHGNLGEFHRPDGAGYEFWADQVADLDSVNPQIAARLARALDRWRKFTPQLQVLMAQALERVAESAQSPDVREIVTKALAAPPQAPQEHPK